MHPRERSYTELVKGSVPIAGRQNAYGDMQPDVENCSNGIAPQPNTTADSRKMTVHPKRSEEVKGRVEICEANTTRP